ncbi:UDP-N-acetylglucosamine 2-epimerase (non-hydrolyzing) [Actinosynnema sp. NPDC020468]|uniref:non-hydrolyzing UDP-N-acetylglucosamine 2-epimerase n=1 Tax=Actinosynnema sp. NPDC020468 TaxID=3154488 RepID=UPI0033D80E0C
MRHVLAVYGTRPEAIKTAPLIAGLRADPRFRSTVLVTGQHRELLDQVNRLFDIQPDEDLDLCAPGQTPESLTADVVRALVPRFDALKPDVVVVQGDTTTAFAAALAAHYARVPVAHLEAGLRSHAPDPFPEEANRRLITVLAALHLAPTPANRDNLLRENVPADRIAVTGNTGLDALWSVATGLGAYHDPVLGVLAARRHVLVTAHRRESWGEPLDRIARAVRALAELEPDVVFVVPLHRNPVVRHVLCARLLGVPNVLLTEPLSYHDTVRLVAEAHLVLTDSGGLQEEAPALGTPVLVLRDATERTESLDSGAARLVGTCEQHIVALATRLLHDPAEHARMTRGGCPYGDGAATARCLDALAGLPPRPVC